jgi:hypothetical protein
MGRIHTQFGRIGARVDILPPPRSGRVTVDIAGDVFQLAKERSVVARVLHAAPAARHLLLLTDDGDRKDRYVCGHDERHWFVAAVPGTPITVPEALEQLKPRAVSQRRLRAPGRVVLPPRAGRAARRVAHPAP